MGVLNIINLLKTFYNQPCYNKFLFLTLHNIKVLKPRCFSPKCVGTLKNIIKVGVTIIRNIFGDHIQKKLAVKKLSLSNSTNTKN